MRIRIKNEFAIIIILSLILIVVISVLPDLQIARIVLGIPFLLLFPGYALISAIFPKRGDLDSIEKLLLSVSLSITVVPLMGFLLNFSPWGLRLHTVLVSIGISVAVLCAISMYRRRGLETEEKPFSPFSLSLPRKYDLPKLSKVSPTTILVIAIICAFGVLGYAINEPDKREAYTEFYILGIDGKAKGYPKELSLGEKGELLLGIVNRESETVWYGVEITIAGEPVIEMDPVELDHGQRWEDTVEFVLTEASAGTSLVRDVYQLYGPFWADHTDIEVESAEDFKLRDDIMIEGEHAKIHTIQDNTIKLTRSLEHHHPSGSTVAQIQGVRFRLFKTYNLENDGGQHTSLTLSLGTDQLSATITNQSENDASYRSVVESRVITPNIDKPTLRSKASGPVVMSPDDQWELEMEYAYPEAVVSKVMLSLFHEDELIYHEEVSQGYPTLHLWIKALPVSEEARESANRRT